MVNLTGAKGGIVLTAMICELKFSSFNSPFLTYSLHFSLLVQILSCISSETNSREPFPSGAKPISSTSSLSRVILETRSSVSINQSGFSSATFLSTRLTPPPGNAQKSGKDGTSETLWHSKISPIFSLVLLTMSDADGLGFATSAVGNLTPSGNSSIHLRRGL